MAVVFCDTETTGLDPTRHEVWEIAVIEEDGTEYSWAMWPDLSVADPNALRINRFYERAANLEWAEHSGVAADVARLTAGAHLVGAVPSFDAGFLDPFLRRFGYCGAWHYHVVCAETLVAGRLQLPPPWDSQDLSRQMGVDPDQFERHTALGDARWAKALYDAVMGAEK
jgi:DNA polymerase III epsilon subunit-like protein